MNERLNNPTIQPSIRELANAIRFLSIDAIEKAKSGHPGITLGIADVATTLFCNHLSFDATWPDWPNRDRFVLSAGHGSMLLYSLLYLCGYKNITLDDLKNFRQLHSKTAGHPEVGLIEGIEATTGPLGQGIAMAVGMAIAEKIQSQRQSIDLINHYTYTIVGDGCLMEGVSQEAISLAGHLGLNKLIVLWDDNGITIDGATSISTSENMAMRFKSCGWDVWQVDGHNPDDIDSVIRMAKATNKPSLIACKTIIGFGAPTKSGSEKCHGSPLGLAEIEGVREKLNWHHEPFLIPDELLNAWRLIGKKGQALAVGWKTQLAALSAKQQDLFNREQQGALPDNLDDVIWSLKSTFIGDAPNIATRKASQLCLAGLTKNIPNVIGGSADLSGSNLTKTEHLTPINRDNFNGRYIYYGVREHAMGAIMNGISLYKGLIPFGGTFLCFSDYMRPAIRLSALMKQRVIYVMTHDSIGLGEDGPTHQPVEHIASLRAIPNLNVYRPADAVETLECWALALKSLGTPSVLVLSRQNMPVLPHEKGPVNLCEKGAYVVSGAENPLKLTIFASGSEVEIALGVRKLLEGEGIGTRVVSMVCMEVFDQQPLEYRNALINASTFNVAIEAACEMGWHKYIGKEGLFFGMPSFGESGPADDLYRHFGLNPEAISRQLQAVLK